MHIDKADMIVVAECIIRQSATLVESVTSTGSVQSWIKKYGYLHIHDSPFGNIIKARHIPNKLKPINENAFKSKNFAKII